MMLVEFVKNKKGQRIGVVVAVNSEALGHPNIGWSKCSGRDKFTSHQALLIAKGRAEKRLCRSVDDSYFSHGVLHQLPPSIFDAVDGKGNNIVDKMRVRMTKYFKAEGWDKIF